MEISNKKIKSLGFFLIVLTVLTQSQLIDETVVTLTPVSQENIVSDFLHE
jgi:hypothetical protein